MSNRTAPTPMAELVETLWYERRLLEFLLFKLVSANLVLSSADRRFVGSAVDEVEQVLDRVRRAESDRHRVVQNLATMWGEPASSLTLSELARRAEVPFAQELRDCQLAFARLVDEIDKVAKANRQLATVGLGDLRAAFGVEASLTYAPSAAAPAPAASAAVHIDRRL